MPYEYRLEGQDLHEQKLVPSSFNEGLWWGTPDINGIDKLNMDPTLEHPELLLIGEGTPLSPRYSYLLKGQHLPLSIMNVQLKRELIPAFCQPPDYQVWNGFKVRRHDDVWSAYFLKTVMDYTGDIMTFGAPLVHHRKAGNAIREVLSEHHTNLIQPYLNMVLDDAGNSLAGSDKDYVQLAHRLADSARTLVLQHPNTPSLYAGILAEYFRNCLAWADGCGSV